MQGVLCPECRNLLDRKTGRCATCAGEDRVKVRPLPVAKSAQPRGGPGRPQPSRFSPPREPPAPRPAPARSQPEARLDIPVTGKFFPFGAPRDGQREFLADVEETIRQGRHLVAHAPTGLGKTVSTLAPAVEFALASKKKVFFLTSKQSQHRIAVETLKAIKRSSGQDVVVIDLIAKQDMCPRREARDLFGRSFARFCRREQVSKTCAYWEMDNKQAVKALRVEVRHVDEQVSMCKSMGVCPPQASIEAAQEAHVVVCDYNLFFSDMLNSTAERFKLKLEDVVLVVDEAHNLPDRIRDHLSLSLNDYVLSDAKDELRTIDEDALAAAVDKLQAAFLDLPDKLAAEKDLRRAEKPIDRDAGIAFLEEALGGGKGGRRTLMAWDLDTFTKELGVAAARYEKNRKEDPRGMNAVLDFLRNWRIERRGLVRVLSCDPNPAMLYKALDASVLARPVFNAVHASVVMSGTLHPPTMTRDVLGLAEARTTLRTYASPFPPQNRLVLVDDEVTTQYTKRGPETWERIAERLAAVADATPGAVAAFFPSYGTLEEVRAVLPSFLSKELIVEEREDSKAAKEALVQMLRDGTDALLLGVQGGSLSEGYDYEGNMLKAVVVVGLPFAAPSLEVEALIAFLTQKFGPGHGRTYAYVAPTMNRVLQAAGRLIRSPTDRGVVVLMDKRFAWKDYRDLYPPDFRPAVVADPAAEVRKFWAR